MPFLNFVREKNMAEFLSFFKTVQGNEGKLCNYPTRLDTYGCGCSHDCSYCYAKSLLPFRGLWNINEPRVADIRKIERVIKRLPAGSVVRLGGMTDCFQPCEDVHHVTLETIKLLNKYGVGYLVVTKSHLIAEPEYIDALDPALAHVQISVTNTDNVKAVKYEKASPVSFRLTALERLQERGFDVALRMSPYIAPFIDLVHIAARNPKKAQLEFLRVNHWIEKWLGGMVDLSPYTLKHGGYRHLPLDEKVRQYERIKKALPYTEISVCEDVPEHWRYWRENVNPNQNDCCNLRV